MVLAAPALLAAALFAAAAPRASLPPPAPANEVSALIIYPPTPVPRLVASYPAEGGTIAPGVLVLKLTFDQIMSRTGFDIAPVVAASTTGAPVPGPETPTCLKTPRLLNDGRTFVLLCTLRAGRAYALAFNSAPAGGFANIAENRAGPTSLRFTTSRDDPVRSLDEAMKLQGLTPLEVPVQESPGD